ncbi:MAG: T9SS type A sorting domain-containing protein [Cytophagales bacterium]|nr:T9SS type A sorting domain-containing protein [Cytophagales bacterium]
MKTKRNYSVLAAFLGLALLSSNYASAQAPVANFSANPDSGCEPLTVNFTDSSTNAPTSWLWDFGDGSPMDTAQNSVHFYLSGTYNIMLIVSNGFGSDTMFKSIVAYPSPTAGFTYNGNQCLTGNSYSFTNTGTPGASYSWDFGDATISTLENPTHFYASCVSYTVTQTVTDTNNGCSDALSMVVTVFCEPTASIVGTNATCNGYCDGAANLTVTGGTAPYSYSWSNGAITQDLTNLCAGSYNVTLIDIIGCFDTASVVISEPAAIAISFTTVSNVSCNGGSDGSATAAVTGGPYTFLWDNAEIDSIALALTGGTHTVTVTDGIGCFDTASVVISEPAALSLTIITTDESAPGACDGIANVTVSGGIPFYTYSWSPTGGTGPTASNLCPGIYTVVVSDANACVAAGAAIINTAACTFTLTTTTTDDTCGLCDGSANASASGGAAPYTFLWDDPALQTTQTATGLCAGTYTVQVTDTNSCSAINTAVVADTGTFTVTITSTTDVTCFGNCDGSATANPIGGTAPYSYLWSDAFVGPLHSAMCVGTYTVYVTDSTGCTVSQSVTINQPAALNTAIIGVYVSCNGVCDGVADLIVVGGTIPYTYSWSNGDSTQDIFGLCADTFSVTITDSNLCTTSNSVIISEPSILISNITGTNISCNGFCDGALNLTVFGGTPPFMYSWANGATTEDCNSPGLCAGTMIVVVTDANGCTVTDSITLTEPPALNVMTTSITDAICGLCDGSATVSVSGGTLPYTYLWNTSPVQLDSTATSLCAGTYTVQVTDFNGCFAVDTAVVADSGAFTVAITSTDVTCFGNCDGSATATPFGGVPPYVYSWSNGALGQTAVALCAGTYMVCVTDSTGCTVCQSVPINQPLPIVTTITTTDATCGNCDGTAAAAPANGTPPYSFLWSDLQTTDTAIGLCAGAYTVVIADSNGCSVTDTAVVAGSGTFTLSITSTDVSCNGDSNGVAMVTPIGGIAPYTYLWNDPLAQTDPIADSLAPGTYIVTVTDSTGCAVTTSATISQPAVLIVTLSIINVGCAVPNDGNFTIIASGGIGSYVYSIDSGAAWSATNVFDSLSAGIYFVFVQDSNGCEISVTAIITTTTTPNITLTLTNPSVCGYVGNVSYSISGGTPPYSIQWDTQPHYWNWWSSFAYLYPGTYTMTATDANGCMRDTTFTILSPCLPNLITGSVFDDMNANCIMDSSDYGLSGWMVRADPGAVYAYTNNWGFFQLHLDSGNYTISLLDNDNIRSQVCPVSPPTYNLNLGSSPNTIDSIDFTVQTDFYCPDLSIDLNHIGYRPCFSSFYVVDYCNNGTGVATNAYIEIELPDIVTADTNSTHTWYNYAISHGYLVPWTTQNGNTYTFDVGNLVPDECGRFVVLINISCSAVMNSTHCVTAHIYPDSSCFPADSTWDRSSISVEGSCVNDSLACFTIYNTGDPGTGDMQGTSQYRIYENNMLISTGAFQLAGGDSVVVCWPANGNTIRLEADQRPGHPGNSHPQDNVEMCGGTPFITGQITQVPTDDADDFVDIECGPVVSSWDPNDKNVRPEGLTNTFHFIDSTDILEYNIRFQNTGTDTAFNIVLRDTLSATLDITTIVLGASSHPYTLEIFGSDILQWTFNNVLLPDSNVNEPESHGFVKFKIHQKPGNAIGTVIENDAGIIFDFNDPVITNKVFNTIGNIDSITTNVSKIYDKQISINVYPNPFSSTTTFEINSTSTFKLRYTFELYNIIGKKVKEISNITGNRFVISRKNLPEGIYIYKIRSKDGLIGAGKLMVN